MSPKSLRVVTIFAQALLVLSFSSYSFAAKTRQPSESSLEHIEKEIRDDIADETTYKGLATVIEREPNNSKARFLLASCYELLGLPQLALEQFQLAYDLAPENPEMVAALFNAEIKAFHTDKAIKVLNDAVKRQTDNAVFMDFIANYMFAHNDPGVSELFYQRLYRHKGVPVGLASALAKIELKNGRYRAASDLASEDLAKDKDLRIAQEVKGLALSHLGNYSAALKPLARAFADKPDSNPTSTAYATSLVWTGQYVEALQPALIALACVKSPHDVSVAKSLLTEIFKKVRSYNWQEQYRLAVNMAPMSQRTNFCLSCGEVLDACNLLDAAIDQYKKSLEFDTNNASAWYYLANDLETKSHDYQQALHCYRKAQVLMPENQFIRQRALRLEDRLSIKSTDWSWLLKDQMKTD